MRQARLSVAKNLPAAGLNRSLHFELSLRGGHYWPCCWWGGFETETAEVISTRVAMSSRALSRVQGANAPKIILQRMYMYLAANSAVDSMHRGAGHGLNRATITFSLNAFASHTGPSEWRWTSARHGHAVRHHTESVRTCMRPPVEGATKRSSPSTARKSSSSSASTGLLSA